MNCINQFTNDYSLHSYLNNIKNKETVTFKSYFKESNIIKKFDNKTQNLLGKIYNQDKCAYSYLLFKQIEKYPDTNIYIVVGAFNDIFNIGISNSANNKPAAYLGHNISNININDEFCFGYEKKETIKFCGKLNKNSYFYHRNFKINDLDDSILIWIPYQKLIDLYGNTVNEELIQNTNFIKNDKQAIQHYVDTINNSKIMNVIPYNSYDLYMENYNFSFYNSLLFFSFFSVFLIFTICGIIINTDNNIDKNLREYAIHITYGATKLKVSLRIILYISFIIFPISIISSLFVYMSDMVSGLSCLKIGLTALLISVFLVLLILIYPFIKLWNNNISTFYRRDV